LVTPSRYRAIREHLLQIDAELVLAAEEADQDLLDWFATLSPRQRLDRAARLAISLERLRDGRTAR
jgi:hypothetical protein